MSDAFPESSRLPIVEAPDVVPAAWAGSEAVYTAAYRNLLRVAFVLTGSAPAAEDVVHDVFAKVGPRIDTLAEPAAYLRVAVVNRCRSLRRRDVAAPRPDSPSDATMDVGLIELRDALGSPADSAAIGDRPALLVRSPRRGDRRRLELSPIDSALPSASRPCRTSRGDPMTSLSDQEFAETETLLRQRLAQLADHAPTAVKLPGEVPVVALPVRRRNRRRIGAVAAVTALVGAGSFTTYSFLAAGRDGGAATPEQAVTTFVSAVEQEDVLGMIDVTLPEEVGVLRDAVTSATADATRLGLLNATFDPNQVEGLDVSVDDLVLDTNYLEGGLAVVTATGGTANVSFDPQTFPFGSTVRELLLAGAQARHTSTDLSATDPPASLMTVQRDGRWYVSVEYTLAEYIRQSTGLEMPAPVVRSPIGFDSPEAAANGFYDRLAALDLQGVLDTFAPGEDAPAWLAQSWLPGANAAIERGRADGWAAGISGLTYESIGNGTRRTLNPVAFKLDGTVPAGFDRSGAGSTGDVGPLPFSVEHADGCSTFRGEGANRLFDLEASQQVKQVDGGFQLCAPGLSGAWGLLLLTGGLSDLPAVSVVESGGKWYVSPLGTLVATVSSSLHDAASGSGLLDTVFAGLLYGVASSSQSSSGGAVTVTSTPISVVP